MAVHPSEVMRFQAIAAKDAEANALIEDIVPMLDELDQQALREVKAVLEVKLLEAELKARNLKESTTVKFLK